MQSPIFPPLPADTVDAAKSLFNIENVYIAIGDQIDNMLDDIVLDDLDPTGRMQPGISSLLAMVTIFQFVENIPDRLAKEVVRTRTDWKYALHLPLIHPGIDPALLNEFRQQLLSNPTSQQVFNAIMLKISKVGLLKSRNNHWTENKTVLLFVSVISQVDRFAQAFSLTLESLAANQPEMLRKMTLPHWYERYKRITQVIQQTNSIEDLNYLLNMIGKDTLYLLETLATSDNLDLGQLQEVQDLKRKYDQLFDRDGNQIKW